MTTKQRYKGKSRKGVLSFEWTLLITLLTIGLVSGLGAVRDAIIDELGDVAEASLSIDQSFSLGVTAELAALGVPVSEFGDTMATFSDCSRANGPVGQTEVASDGE